MSKDLPPSRTADQFVVRFPEGMRDRVAAEAKANGRSMNAEIIARLDRSFVGSEIGFKGDPLDQLARRTLLLSMVVSDKLDGKTKEEIATLAKEAAQKVNEKLVFATDGINHVEMVGPITEVTEVRASTKRKK